MRDGEATKKRAAMVTKRRSVFGERQRNAKLNEQQVREIRAQYAICPVTHRELAERYGVSAGAVRLVIKRETWAHTEPEAQP